MATENLETYHAQLQWLDDLCEAAGGGANMRGAVRPLQEKFGLSEAEAQALVTDWIRMRRWDER